jgi:TolB protein
VYRVVIFIIALLWAIGAHAILTIHITQGADKPFPIAIVPFSQPMVEAKYLPQGITGVVANDLKLSGRFRVVEQSLVQQPHSIKAFNASLWRHSSLHVDYVLLGKITPDGNGQYNVTVSLMNLFADRPVLGQAFSHVPGSQLNALAHHISDLVYSTITGVKGIFSTHLAYVSVTGHSGNTLYRLVVANADGNNPQILLQQRNLPIASPQWSADGKQIAYVSYHNNRMGIFSVNVATGQRKLIAYFPGINSAPAWSPDGTKMAMALSKGGGANTNIYVMNLSNKQLTRYTTFGNNTSPSWTPDGQSLIFNSNRGGSPQLYQINLQSHEVHRLTYQGVQNFDPVVTPDGQVVVYMHQAQAGGPIQLSTYNLATGNSQVITQGRLDKSPSVSPNGQMVIYANYDHNNGVLAEVSIDGKIQLTLPSTQGSVQSPAWSPF